MNNSIEFAAIARGLRREQRGEDHLSDRVVHSRAVSRLVAVGIAVTPATAYADVHALFGLDTYLATAPASLDENEADIAWSGHVEWNDGDLRGLVADYVERESFIGGEPRRELHELAYTERALLPGWSFTVGRFRIPGGFWLIADGGKVGVRAGNVEFDVYGGNRSFTNARVETLLRLDPTPLPLVGAALTTHGDIQAELAYTYTADIVTLYRGDLDGVEQTAESRQPQQFIDGELVAAIGEHGFLTGGATAGSRYLVTYPTNAVQLANNPTLQNVFYGSQSGYVMVDEKVDDWRLAGTLTAERTQFGQVSDPGALAALSGSFLESSVRATWHMPKVWRVDMRYRLRLWADGGRAQRAQAVFDYRHGELDIQASVGADLHHNLDTDPGYTSSRSLLYKASIGRKTSGNELSIGAAAVSNLGDETAAAVPVDNVTSTTGETAPYTLEARSYAFAHGFATRGAWFCGADFEIDLHGDGERLLAQLGWAY